MTDREAAIELMVRVHGSEHYRHLSVLQYETKLFEKSWGCVGDDDGAHRVTVEIGGHIMRGREVGDLHGAPIIWED